MLSYRDNVAEGLVAEQFPIDSIANVAAIQVDYLPEHGIQMHCHFLHDQQAYGFRFFFSVDYLSRFETSFDNPFPLWMASSKVFDVESETFCKLKHTFTELAENTLQGVYRQIFLESKALHLLLYTHTDCEEKEDARACFKCKFLNIPSEKQKILQARVLLMINISSPPSIPQLAKAVHINDCYLKKGFREMFGSSVFDFVQQERIKKAKHLLLQTTKSILDIALELGYSNTSNFTNAYKKLTGYAPTEYQRMHQAG
ncbi:MAG: helix-turn-helix transcriptional regulator [Chitinophagaceae bacterium]|nr:helix-turn-helix transcriptional regulator [Chitinophagaceae bacterium]